MTEKFKYESANVSSEKCYDGRSLVHLFVLDDVPPSLVESVRDYCQEEHEGKFKALLVRRIGTFGKRALIPYELYQILAAPDIELVGTFIKRYIFGESPIAEIIYCNHPAPADFVMLEEVWDFLAANFLGGYAKNEDE